MIGKGNLRQRAISDYEFVKKKTKAQFVVQLHEGRLYINVARIGSMYPIVKFSLGSEVWKSETSEIGGHYPKWNQFFSFPLDIQRNLEVIVFDKSIIFGETEIGRCTILLSDVVQGRLTEWWDILTPSGQLAGAIFLSFEFPSAEPSGMHASKNSWDLKMHHHIESSPVVRVKGKTLTQVSKLTPDIKSMTSLTSTLVTEQFELEYENSKSELIEKQERCKNQEITYLNDIQKSKEENNLIRIEKSDIKKNNEVLQCKEEDILKEKEWMKKERAGIEEEKETLVKQLDLLNQEYMKLKREKLRIRAQKTVQENCKRRLERKNFVARMKCLKCEN